MRFVPAMTMIKYSNHFDNYELVYLAYWFILISFVYLFKKPKIAPIKNTKGTNNMMNSLLFGSVFIIIFISAVYANFNLTFSFSNVYDLRMNARQFEMPLLLSYAWPIATAILPLFLIVGLMKRNYLLSAFVFFIIVVDFSIDGLKGKLFMAFLIVLLHFIYNERLRVYYSVLFSSLIMLGMVMLVAVGDDSLNNLVIRRTLLVPANLDGLYYDYISRFGPTYYDRSSTSVQFLISDYYYGKDEMRSNNGFFSDAFMNLGIIGVLLYPVIMAYLLKVCESAFKYLQTEMKAYLAITFVLTLSAAEFTTAMLTHGIFMITLSAYIISSSRKPETKTPYNFSIT